MQILNICHLAIFEKKAFSGNFLEKKWQFSGNFCHEYGVFSPQELTASQINY